MSSNNEVGWGIIGCGSVTEIKSGPAFNLVENSKLVAVMRRSPGKAEDYARRHGVPRWYTEAGKLIHDPEVNAVYVATPPGTHDIYALMAIQAGKHVYVEKPMALDYSRCRKMIKEAKGAGVKLFVAYYRRALPYFLKIKELLDSGAIGTPRLARVRLHKPIPRELDGHEELPWRFKPGISGGGLFVDLGSHQLDLLDFLFGPITSVHGVAANQAGLSQVEDIVCADFAFESGVLGSGSWCFTVPEKQEADEIEILGSTGKISFSTFDFDPVILETASGKEKFKFDRPPHIQEALVRTVVEAILEKGECPSTGVSAARTTRAMGTILKEYYKDIDI